MSERQIVVITFAGKVTLGVVTSLVRSVVSVVIDSELELGTLVMVANSNLFVTETGELANTWPTVVDNVVDGDSAVSALSFGVVVKMLGDSCEMIVVIMDVAVDDDDDGSDDDGNGGCVTSNDGY